MVQIVQTNLDERIETGAVQIGDDWPGLFIRGDECLRLSMIIDDILSGKSLFPLDRAELGRIRTMIVRDVHLSGRNTLLDDGYTEERYEREMETGRCSYCGRLVLECVCD